MPAIAFSAGPRNCVTADSIGFKPGQLGAFLALLKSFRAFRTDHGLKITADSIATETEFDVCVLKLGGVVSGVDGSGGVGIGGIGSEMVGSGEGRSSGSEGGSVELGGSEVGVWTLSRGDNATSWPIIGPGYYTFKSCGSWLHRQARHMRVYMFLHG